MKHPTTKEPKIEITQNSELDKVYDQLNKVTLERDALNKRVKELERVIKNISAILNQPKQNLKIDTNVM